MVVQYFELTVVDCLFGWFVAWMLYLDMIACKVSTARLLGTTLVRIHEFQTLERLWVESVC